MRLLVLALLALPACAQLNYLNHGRPLLDAHNCYPYKGEWKDRIDRALSTGYPVGIEQDLAWYVDPATKKERVVVSHSDEPTGTEPTLREYFFERVRPIVEKALQENQRSQWPLIVVHFDFKSNQAPLLHAVWGLLGEYQDWLTTAVKTADPHQLSPFDPKPLLALTEVADEQEEVFFNEVPVGGKLRLFGSAHTREIRAEPKAERERLLATLPPEELLQEKPTNYRRWWNNSWHEVEEGGQRVAGEWTAADDRRLHALVDHAHKLGYWIRFYTLDGFTPATDQGWDEGYNFGSRAEAEARWKAAMAAGVDLIATDQFEDLRETMKSVAAAVPKPPGVVIDHEPPLEARYIGSPSIVILPGGAYLASHDFFGRGSTQSSSAVSRVFRSTDHGKTWRQTAEMHDQFWSNLFARGRDVYLMGTTCEYGRVVIRKSEDGGSTWSSPSFLTDEPGYHTAPVPVVEKDGRLWRGMEYHPQGPWGHFEALMLSAPVDSDLMDPKSWTMTTRLAFPASGAPGKHWLEGNAVIGPDGSLLDILRVDNLEKAAIVKVAKGELQFEGLVDFPGGAKKFTIRYDRESKRYWALSNPALEEYPKSATDPASVRNTLALMSSSNLHDWRVERIVLSNPDPVRHAFQYADWQYDGPDIVLVSRTAFDDEAGGAPRGHDANYLTFHRITNFRRATDAGKR